LLEEALIVLDFSIVHWQARAAALADGAAWQRWAERPFCPLADKAFSDSADFLPAMQRRRLSDLARGVFACVWPLMEAAGQAPLPLVFASRHGETPRSFGLLQAASRDEALSPTAFCLSVHNAIAAQCAIARGETAESVALAADGDGLEQGFVEAALLLSAGHRRVLLVVAEERPPAAYLPWVDDVPFSYVLAFLVSAGSDFRLSRQNYAPPVEQQSLPNPLNFLRHFLLDTPLWTQGGGQDGTRGWQWERGAHG